MSVNNGACIKRAALDVEGRRHLSAFNWKAITRDAGAQLQERSVKVGISYRDVVGLHFQIQH